MPIQFSPIVDAPVRGRGSNFSVQSLDLHELGLPFAPVVVVDDFRVTGQPFGPHPHAGFAAVTYVFEDSSASLRSRDSLGNDLVVGPGGIVWTHAGSGVLHEELPAERGHQLHGLQFFVNLSAANKLSSPRVLHLPGEDVPEWSNAAGDRVRVVVGSFGNVPSQLVPTEPFTLLDVALRHGISYRLQRDHNLIVYVFEGTVVARADGGERSISRSQAIALAGDGEVVTFEASTPARMLVLAGAEIKEPVVSNGPFIMNDESQIEAAIARYRAGQMGRLEPASIQ